MRSPSVFDPPLYIDLCGVRHPIMRRPRWISFIGPTMPKPEPEPALKLWEVKSIDGTSMSGGLIDKGLVWAFTKKDAVAWGDKNLRGSGYSECFAHEIAEPGQA